MWMEMMGTTGIELDNANVCKGQGELVDIEPGNVAELLKKLPLNNRIFFVDTLDSPQMSDADARCRIARRTPVRACRVCMASKLTTRLPPWLSPKGMTDHAPANGYTNYSTIVAFIA